MSIYHCSIKIISRSGGRSAVASAAYRSGQKLMNDETGILHDFSAKGGVVMSEILLPKHVPLIYQDRQVLWNEVQKTEKRSDAQLAREVEVAFPIEMDREQQIECVRNFIRENFVSKGMIADWALHDKGDGNPHAHIMLTVRGFDDSGQWQQKTKTVFANVRDAEGRAAFDPSLPSYDPKDREHTSQYRLPLLDENGKQNASPTIKLPERSPP
jgi:ATP-dependent exoDNAse (exonuclease V) alpha subunit